MRQDLVFALVCVALAACGRGDVSAPERPPEINISCGSEELLPTAPG